MPFSLAELRHRAADFGRQHAATHDEKSDDQNFVRDLLDVFTPQGRRRAQFQVRVKKPDGSQGYIDALWPGTLLVEMKSRGRDLEAAYQQALTYLPGLPTAHLPPYVLVSDFQRLRLYDRDQGLQHEFALGELPEHLHLFGFLTGYRPAGQQRPEDPANAEAAELMAQLHDALLADGYQGHPLEVLLVRLLFCLFAEDTAIFEKDELRSLLEEHTAPDGHDLGAKLVELFGVLDTPPAQRSRALPAHLASFPYVNGALFSENFRPPVFTPATRQRLIDCTYFDWSRISPAVFGSLFQSIADPRQRRTLGAHYTSEPNIGKVLDPLLLDGLRQELAAAGTSRPALTRLQQRLAGLRLLDPACGCGNFLVVAYRELRLLEHEVLDRLYAREVAAGRNVNLALYQLVRVEQVAGIEVEEFAARIAEVALWLMDHQLNLALSARFDQRYVRLPLTSGARILNQNALRTDWAAEFPGLDYIVGNPPFGGKHYQKPEQKADLVAVGAGSRIHNASDLDFVAAWFIKAATYIDQHPDTRAAFVSTNSVVQGEQVGILWPPLLRRGFHIQFAHQTFKWSNEARSNAAVHCVIVGFGKQLIEPRRLFAYASPSATPHELTTTQISPYLLPTAETVVQKRREPFGGFPAMRCGSKPSDGGNLILTTAEKDELLAQEPEAASLLRPYIGAEEYINGNPRWCLWLENAAPSLLQRLPLVRQRLEAVRQFRLASTAPPTRAAAATPSRFFFVSQPANEYLLIPETSSERRQYIPIGFVSPNIIASNKAYLIDSASPFLFGLLSSAMHMAWMRVVAGRLENRYSYSGSLVYNNYPFPLAPTEAQKQAVAAAAEEVLAARAQFAGESLAALYDPATMPPALARAHQVLDRAVDRCYRPQPFATELARLEFLFGLYQQLSAPVLGAPAKKGRGKQA
ncbi:class I SAM-dependent DNA methyltransferase [Hymenobacter sp. RP-2-7]|uniref:site-specific DNA-methyltransferase (adenine-specific) n=1 Tax=Hymenobacter polaris TaxID=2682546 RepID=A0A7Y0FMA5_9BACT|nr:DNA methyltransferase [Hymenobacter polaris]NML65296.1 class I SAM-dependent DNA methyltransferase [Hymenobacter polaris]